MSSNHVHRANPCETGIRIAAVIANGADRA
jgi:hypothetical protein